MTQFFRKWTNRSKSVPQKKQEKTDIDAPGISVNNESSGVDVNIENASDKKQVSANNTPTISEKTLPLPFFNEKYLTDQMDAAFAQSTGRQRDHNEDSLFMSTCTLTNQQKKIPFGVYIVADGMGGHSNGEIASGIATKSIGSHLLINLYPQLVDDSTRISEESVREIVQNSVKEAHQLIAENAPGGGTTLTAVIIIDDQMTIAHVGDSRAYHITEGGEIQALTRDHSFVRKLVELGQITPEEAALHPQRNVLYRALGQSDSYDVDLFNLPLPKSGHLLICSDGLWGLIPESDLVQITNTSENPGKAAHRLVAAANGAGGPDNITAILVRLQV